uniref:NADH-ubiquinone oxidoreductase chain 3 n=1 Tax=Rhynchothorax sp. JZ-2022 TaxID=2992009 RepID=A0A9E8ADK8_9CHEL|nr:NADH dehydrogenase subunit 3 [Rhynchothorax sp. JZ-2022]
MMLMMSLIMMVTMIIIILSLFISKMSYKEMNKSSPIECGMDPMGSPRNPFSIQFFLIAILFMIFDVEIALILPLPLIKLINLTILFISSLLFLLILLLGLLYEWYNGALE